MASINRIDDYCESSKIQCGCAMIHLDMSQSYLVDALINSPDRVMTLSQGLYPCGGSVRWLTPMYE